MKEADLVVLNSGSFKSILSGGFVSQECLEYRTSKCPFAKHNTLRCGLCELAERDFTSLRKYLEKSGYVVGSPLSVEANEALQIEAALGGTIVKVAMHRGAFRCVTNGRHKG